MVNVYLDDSTDNVYSDKHVPHSAGVLQPDHAQLPPVPTAESFRRKHPSHSFAITLKLDMSSFHVTNVRAAGIQHKQDRKVVTRDQSAQSVCESIELSGLTHHTSLRNSSQPTDSVVCQGVNKLDAFNRNDKSPNHINNGVVEWIASRDATEHTRRPVFMSTETGVPLYFEVPPLLRWLEGRGLNLPPEMARHYYNVFK